MKKNNLLSLVLSTASHQKFRYLFAGVWNTAFGYICGITIYYLFGERLGVFLVGVITNILAISMSFLTYKIFVFKTNGNWLHEYIRAYMVYGVSAVIGIFLLLIFVKLLSFQFWLGQGLATFLVVLVSYIGHKKFTFNIKK